MENTFHSDLRALIDNYVHGIYRITRSFPSEEKFGITSQIRRCSMSVALNYIEGFARKNQKEYRNFLRIAYASLKESEYLLDFSLKEGFILPDDHLSLSDANKSIGAMLWGVIRSIENKD